MHLGHNACCGVGRTVALFLRAVSYHIYICVCKTKQNGACVISLGFTVLPQCLCVRSGCSPTVSHVASRVIYQVDGGEDDVLLS